MKTRTFLFSLTILLALSLIILVNKVYSQNIAVTDSSSYEAKSSAMLDVQSSGKGMLVPRMTTSQRLSISSPAEGLLVYDMNYQTFFYYEQDEWLSLSSVSSSSDPDKALFHVTNSNGDTVFAVYNDGVEVVVSEESKGNVGGFAVSGRSANKATKQSILKVTPDSTHIVVKDTSSKGKVGGFAVSGRSANKGNTEHIFTTNKDSTRIYVTESSKGQVGGFAVSGRTANKSTTNRFMDLTKDNYLIGHESGSELTTANYNSFIGYQAGKFTTSGGSNIFLGYQSGYSNTTGTNNTFLGNQAGKNNVSGDENVFLGNNAGFNNEGGSSWDGDDNVFIGTAAGYSNTIGHDNIYIGNSAGYSNPGIYNTIIGSDAGENSTSDFNTYMGKSAGRNDEGGSNTYIGHGVARYNTTGTKNVYLGGRAGFWGTKGSHNVIIGYGAGELANGEALGSGNVIIGYDAADSEAGISNRLFIENTNSDSSLALIYGEFDNNILTFNADVGIGTTTPTYDLDIARTNATISLNGLEISNMGSNNMGIDGDIIPYSSTTYDIGNNVTGEHWDDVVANDFLTPSDKRTKKNIDNLNIGLPEIMRLRPVQFQYKKEYDNDGGIKYGLVAQEVEEVMPYLVKGQGVDMDQETGKKKITKGEFKTLNYTKLIPVLIKAVQHQQREKEALEQRVEKLEKELNELKTLIQSQN